MKSIMQLCLGLFTAAASALFVLGAVSLSLVEGQATPAAVLPPDPTVTLLPARTIQPGVTLPPTQTAAATETTTVTATVPPLQPTQPLPTPCIPPRDWVAYTIQPGDDLNAIAQRANKNSGQILQANCMVSSTLLPGTILYLPFSDPTSTVPPALPTAAPCGPPRGWVRYTIQPDDTLFRLSKIFGVSVSQLQMANCLSGTVIRAGSPLYVPYVPTRTPRPPTPTVPTATQTPNPPTWTQEPTATPETPVITLPPVDPTPEVTKDTTPEPTNPIPTAEKPGVTTHRIESTTI